MTKLKLEDYRCDICRLPSEPGTCELCRNRVGPMVRRSLMAAIITGLMLILARAWRANREEV